MVVICKDSNICPTNYSFSFRDSPKVAEKPKTAKDDSLAVL